MSIEKIEYKKTGYFSKLMVDYLAEDKELSKFYGRFPNLENFEDQLNNKKKSFSQQSRNVLVAQLKKQYEGFKISKAISTHIEKLKESNTFTVTTGHQLNIFTGPLYFLYKIFSTINLAEQLNSKYSKNHFVPIYWMASEDHDFDEINYFNFRGKKVHWEKNSKGAVGELSTEGLDAVLEAFSKELGASENALKLISLFKESYIQHKNLADATRYLANTLFAEYGLVIIDGNDSTLKKAFIPYAEKELFENLSNKKVSKTTERLTALNYSEQVHPREINLFYLKENLRERIIEKDKKYFINESDISFTSEEIEKELQNHPERFSPNALLRPLFQEVILPNLCYIGGGGELAYWFQLKDYFDEVAVDFPILLLRNSALLIPKNLSEKLTKLDVSIADLFQKQENLEAQHTKKLSEIEIDFTSQRALLKKQFVALYKLAKETDQSFYGAVAAQEKKQLNGLDHLEKRLLKAQKRKLSDQLERLTDIQDSLFPKQSLQERTVNFSEFYLEYGEKLFDEIKRNLEPLTLEFSVINL